MRKIGRLACKACASKKSLIITLAVVNVAVPSQADAGSCTWSWTATITDDVRRNSQGVQLNTIGQVLAQERLAFWLDLLPEWSDSITGSEYWEPPLRGNNTFHYKGYRDILTQIPRDKFDISDPLREAFWVCPSIEVRIRKEGWDCDAESTHSVTITSQSADLCS